MFSLKLKSLMVVVAGAGLASAQLSGLSSQCQNTLAQIVTSPNAQCLDAQALIGLVTAGTNTSLIGPINSWLTGMCAQPQCTNDTLSNVVTNVTSGCQTELKSLGIASINEQDLIQIVEMAYPTVRKVACLSDTSNNNTLCVTELLTNIQPFTGTLSLTGVESLVSKASGGSFPTIPSNVLCTNCTKQALNIVKGDFPDIIPGNVQSTISSTCGADFVNGATPSQIKQSANTATASASSSLGTTGGAYAFGVNSFSVAVASLVAILSGFAFFA